MSSQGRSWIGDAPSPPPRSLEEWQERPKLLEKIMNKTRSVTERIVELNKLTPEQQLMIFYPSLIPPRLAPDDWNETINKTISNLERDVRNIFTDRKRPREEVADSDSDESSLEPESPMYATWKKRRKHMFLK
jgi:hypothetical protein